MCCPSVSAARLGNAVVISVDHTPVFRTRVAKFNLYGFPTQLAPGGCLTPVMVANFKDAFTLEIYYPDTVVTIDLYDKDYFHNLDPDACDLIHSEEVPVSRLLPNQTSSVMCEGWFDVPMARRLDERDLVSEELQLPSVVCTQFILNIACKFYASHSSSLTFGGAGLGACLLTRPRPRPRQSRGLVHETFDLMVFKDLFQRLLKLKRGRLLGGAKPYVHSILDLRRPGHLVAILAALWLPLRGGVGSSLLLVLALLLRYPYDVCTGPIDPPPPNKKKSQAVTPSMNSLLKWVRP